MSTEDMLIADEDRELNNDNSVVKTICRDCIFAEWQKEGMLFDGPLSMLGPNYLPRTSISQTGCKLGKLDKFQYYREQMEETKKDDYIERKSFFEIQRLCNCCRNAEWEKESNESVESRLAKENAPQVNLLVLVRENVEKEAIDFSVDQILSMDSKPYSVIFVCCSKKQLLYINNVCRVRLKISKIKYYICHVMEDFRDSNLINQGFLKCDGQYYATVYAGNKFDTSFIDAINYLVNDQLIQISLLHEFEKGLELLDNAEQTEKLINSYHPFVVQNALHRILGGYGVHTIFNKVLALAKEQGKEAMLWDWNDLAEQVECNQE